MKILIVEDEAGIARIVSRALKEASYAVSIADNGRAAIEALELDTFDLIVLDLLIPGIEGGGLALCRKIRKDGLALPILILTALDSTTSKVTGLDAGADDYITKPFSVVELLARIRALLRRNGNTLKPLEIGDLILLPATRQASRNGRIIDLTAKEFAVLEYLVGNAGRIVNQTELLEHVWDYEYNGLSNVVETYIRYLRKKLTLNGEPDIIQTRRGSGYIIETQS